MVWLSRDKFDYVVWAKKPKGEMIFTGLFVDEFCAHDFERITGFKMKPGELKRVRIKVEEA